MRVSPTVRTCGGAATGGSGLASAEAIVFGSASGAGFRRNSAGDSGRFMHDAPSAGATDSATSSPNLSKTGSKGAATADGGVIARVTSRSKSVVEGCSIMPPPSPSTFFGGSHSAQEFLALPNHTWRQADVLLRAIAGQGVKFRGLGRKQCRATPANG